MENISANDTRQILSQTAIQIKCQAKRPSRWILTWHKSYQILKQKKKLSDLYTTNNYFELRLRLVGTEFILLPEKNNKILKNRKSNIKREKNIILNILIESILNTMNIWRKKKKDSESWDMGHKGDKPYGCLSLLPWREFPSPGTGKGKWGKTLSRHWLLGHATCASAAQKGPVFDLMLWSYHLEILNNFYKGSHFNFIWTLQIL